MKFWKKLLSMVLCLALVVGTMPIAPAMAASTDLEVLNGPLAAGDYTIAANKTLEVTKQTSIQTGTTSITGANMATSVVKLKNVLESSAIIGVNAESSSFNAKNITLDAGGFMVGRGIIQMGAGNFSIKPSVTLENVTMKNATGDTESLLNLVRGNLTLKGKIVFDGSAKMDIRISSLIGDNLITLDGLDVGAHPIVLGGSQLTQGVNPLPFAQNATSAEVAKFAIADGLKTENSNYGIYYAEGKLWIGTQAPTRTKWEVNLGTLPTGMTTEDSLKQTVAVGDRMTVTIRPAAGYSFNGLDLTALNNALSGTGLSAVMLPYIAGRSNSFTISGVPTKDVDLSKFTWPTPTKVEATVSDDNGSNSQNYATLGDALSAANSGQTIVMSQTVTAVTNGTLQNGVTLKNSDKSKTFTSTADNYSTIGVAANGDVTLKSGGLDVENSAVTVQEASKSYVVNPNDANVQYRVFIYDGKANVSLRGNTSISVNNGLTFTSSTAGATFPLDGSELKTDGTSVKVAKGNSLTTSLCEGVEFTVNATNGDVTVTKGGEKGAMGSITLGKAGDSFTYGGKTYTAGSDNSKFVINEAGKVKQVSGSVALNDGESVTGTVSGSKIANPQGSKGDKITVEAAEGYDKVTVPAGGDARIDDKNITNTSKTDDLVLKVTAATNGEYVPNNISVISGNGEIRQEFTGNQTYETPSGAKIKVDDEDEHFFVESTIDNSGETTKITDVVTVHREVTINGKQYIKAANTDTLSLEVENGNVSLKSGALSLAKGESIGLNGKTVTNNNESALTVKGGNPAEISLADGESVTLTDKYGKSVTYTAKDAHATLNIAADGSVIFKSGKKLAVSAGGSVKVANGDENGYYTVGSDKAFVVDLENKAVVATTKGDEITNGNGLTFTAGEDGSVFKLDGSELVNDGDSVKVAAGTAANVKVSDDVTVAVPEDGKTNTGAVTITKNSTNASAATVLAEKQGDTFKVGSETKTATANNQQFVIGTTGSASVITAELVGADGKHKAYGDLAGMLENASAGDKVLMKAAPDSNVVGTLKKDVTIADLSDNTYKAVGGDANVTVDIAGQVFLNSGKLEASANGSVSVCPGGEGAIPTAICGDGSSAFTVSMGENGLEKIEIAKKGGSVSWFGGMWTYTAGVDGAAIGSALTLQNVGDSAKYDSTKDNSPNNWVVGFDMGSLGSVVVNGLASGNGSTTFTKVADGYTLNISKAGDSFEYKGKTYTAKSDDTTYHIDNKGNVSLVKGQVALPPSDSLNVKAEGWKNSVSVVAGAGNSAMTNVAADSSKGWAAVMTNESVTIGGKTYIPKDNPATFSFDENGNVALGLGCVELDKGQDIAAMDSGVSIKNTSADENSKVSVKNVTDPTGSSDYSYEVKAPAGGKVSIDGKEYAAVGDTELKLNISVDGEVYLAGDAVDLGKGAGVNVSKAKITNNGNSNLTVSKDGTGALVSAKQGDSFSVNNVNIGSLPKDMDFNIDANGKMTVNLPGGETIEVGGVKYTADTGGSEIVIDENGRLTVSNANTAVSGTTYVVHGTVWAFPNEVATDSVKVGGATVTLTQGGKEAVKLATVTTDADGEYQFDHVPAGIYNIVVEYNGKTLTQLVGISTDMELALEMPRAKVSSEVKVERNAPVGAVVGGLDEVAGSHASGSDNIQIVLTVSDDNEWSDPQLANKKQIPVEISLEKFKNNTKDTSFSNTQVLEIMLTFDTGQKRNFAVYHRNADGSVVPFSQLTERPATGYARDTFYVGYGFIAIYSATFSPYAITYDEVTGGGGSNGGGGSKKPVVNNEQTESGWNNCPQDETCPIAAFADGKPTAWYHDGVHYCIDEELMKGEENNMFNPNNDLTRAMLVTVLYRMQGEPSVSVTDRFSDVSAGQWYSKAVCWAAENEIVNGMGDGTFAPNAPISRQDLAAMLYRYAKAVGIDTTQGGMAVREFSDFESIAEYAVQAMTWAVNTQIIGGYEDNTLRPLGIATRAEVATMLMRLLENVAK